LLINNIMIGVGVFGQTIQHCIWGTEHLSVHSFQCIEAVHCILKKLMLLDTYIQLVFMSCLFIWNKNWQAQKKQWFCFLFLYPFFPRASYPLFLPLIWDNWIMKMMQKVDKGIQESRKAIDNYWMSHWP
jgi:hypothetical protein